MGKRRQTAKTGDKALYKGRPNESVAAASNNSDDDTMYDAVDRFHNRQDFLKLDATGSSTDESEDDGISNRQGIMNIDSSSGDDDSDDDDSAEEQLVAKKREEKDQVSQDEDSSSDSDDDEMLEMEQSDVRDWGSKKSMYYHGDTADLEIGQDAEDAFLEEEAAKEVQAARYEQMDEDDFAMSDDDKEEIKSDRIEANEKPIDMRSARDLSKLSKSDRRRLLESLHPEVLPLVSHFRQSIEELDSRTSVAVKAVLEGDKGTIEAIGATPSGIQYLVSKALLQTSTALNVAMYLLLKSEQVANEANTEADLVDVGGNAASSIESHPVIARLQRLNKLTQKLEDRVESKVKTLPEQMDYLVKACDLMDIEGGEHDSDASSQQNEVSEAEEEVVVVKEKTTSGKQAKTHSTEISDPSSSNEESEDDIAISVMNDARFGLRPQELEADSGSSKKRSRRAVPLDYGDDEEDIGLTTKAAQSLASTLNAIEQRSATRSRKKRSACETETLDEQHDDDALCRGLEMMEAELGRFDSDHEGEAVGEMNGKLDDDPDEDDFYKSMTERSNAKKQKKTAKYAVAPKYPGIDQEVRGERAISKTIMKNRGLVAHKSKLNRNPRVKKREQYRKALVRRKGQVREVRTDEGHKYGGEETGIKSGLSRSRKLGTR